MSKNSQNHVAMTVMAFCCLKVDAVISVGSIYDKLAVTGDTGRALIFTIVFGIVLFAISFTLFLKGMELAQQLHNKKRMINLTIVAGCATVLISISLLMNAWFLGADSMSKEWLNNKIEINIDKGKKVNELYTYAEDEKISLKTIIETSQNWLNCERAVGCVNKQGGGNGQTTLVLSSNLSIAETTLNEISEIANEYHPIIRRIEDTLTRLEFVNEMDHLTFDKKLKQAEIELVALTSEFTELQRLLPVQTFENLFDAYDVTVNQYIAQGLSLVGARTLFNYYSKHAERYKKIARELKRGKLIYIEPIRKPTDWEILTTSSNSIFIWLMSFVLATFGWLLLGIHIIQNTRSKEDLNYYSDSSNHHPTYTALAPSPVSLSDHDIAVRARQMHEERPTRSILQCVKDSAEELNAEIFGKAKRIGDSRAKKIVLLLQEA